MKRGLIALLMMVSIAGAADKYYFAARIGDDHMVKSFVTERTNIPLYRKRTNKKGEDVSIYFVEVNQAQYDAGWDALDNAVKTAAKDAALESMKDIDEVAKMDKAIALTLLDAINNLRSEHGQAAITPAQLKTAVKNKYNSLP